MTADGSDGTLDLPTLKAIREALREAGAPEVEILDRLLAEPPPMPLTPREAFQVFAVLIGIEWRRGKWARCDGISIHRLVTAWREQVAIAEGGES